MFRRGGGSLPFTNITLDISVPDDLADQFPTHNNLHLFKGLSHDTLLSKAQQRDLGIRSLEDMTFKHFVPEMEMIDIAYYEVMTEGDSSGQPFTFPIPTVNITEDFNWDSKVAQAIFENTAKVGSSYFQNFVGSQWMKDEHGNRVRNPEAYSPGAVRSMCCRLQLDLRELLKRGNGLFGSAEMTGSLGVVTINMARLGYLFKNDLEGLYAETRPDHGPFEIHSREETDFRSENVQPWPLSLYIPLPSFPAQPLQHDWRQRNERDGPQLHG
jgi:anaerobic ribonucleoside-triphosphate reductase